MKKLVSLFLALAMLLCAASALAEGVSVTDMLGREVALKAPASRMVVLTASDVEIIYALGAGDRVVAVGAYCDYPEEVLALPRVQSGAETNIEEILALEPDVVVMDIMAQTTEQTAALEQAGVQVVLTNADSIEGTYQAIRLLGAVTGMDAQAEAMIAEMAEAFRQVAEAGIGSGKTVYFEVSPLQWGLWAAGNGSFMQELADLCGLTNIFADQPAWAQVSEEQVIALNPDYIITTTGYWGEGPLPEEEIAARPGWEGVSAVVNGCVFAVDGNVFSRPGPRLVEAAQMLQQLLTEAEQTAPAA